MPPFPPRPRDDRQPPRAPSEAGDENDGGGGGGGGGGVCVCDTHRTLPTNRDVETPGVPGNLTIK